MEKPACYPLSMPSRGGARVRIPTTAPLAAVVLTAVVAIAPLLQSCSASASPYITGGRADRAELTELFGLLREAKGDTAQRFAALRQISANLIRQREYGRLAALLASIRGSSPSEPYGAWYLFTAAYAYEEDGSAPIAAIYYDRVLKDWPDAEVDGRSLHRECLSRLIGIVDSPERRIGYYKELLAGFPEEEAGRNLFLLAKEYERVGDWELAVKTYSEFLPFFGTEVPGYPDPFHYARGIVDFYNSAKDWTFGDLQTLVSAVKSALAAGDAERLRSYRAKVNFFATDWHGDESQSDGRALSDFGESMSGGRIQAAPGLDPGSGPREAYLRTWGWADKISTWYLCFRKIYFPADPDVHGSWEWAGIYFGEKTQ
jgi:tetratricopeptide (TPR) repeat protein